MPITYPHTNAYAAGLCPTYRAQCSVNSLQWDYTETATSGGATATNQNTGGDGSREKPTAIHFYLYAEKNSLRKLTR